MAQEQTPAPVLVTAAGRARRRTGSVAALAGAALLVVAGCASGDAGGSGTTTEPPASTEPATPATPAPLTLTPGSTVVGLPDDLDAPPIDAVAGAARTTDPTLLYVVTFGSSTCPSVADPTATSTGAGAVEVTFPEPGDGACTQDYVPATTVVALPDDVDGAADLTVAVGTWGSATLAAGSDAPGWVLATEG